MIGERKWHILENFLAKNLNLTRNMPGHGLPNMENEQQRDYSNYQNKHIFI